jgi:hypothetical protein
MHFSRLKSKIKFTGFFMLLAKKPDLISIPILEIYEENCNY